MTQLLRPLRERIFDVVFAGRGTSGECGPDAMTLAIAADRFRATLDSAPLDDPETMIGMIDRACSFRWEASRDRGDNPNPKDVSQFRIARFSLTNAVVQGVGNEHGVSDDDLAADEKTYAVTYPDERGLSDAEQIALALGFPALVAMEASADPRAIDIHRDGESIVIPGPGGAVLVETHYRIHYRYYANASHQ